MSGIGHKCRGCGAKKTRAAHVNGGRHAGYPHKQGCKFGDARRVKRTGIQSLNGWSA